MIEIYTLADPRTGEIYYVGQSKNAKSRGHQHKSKPLECLKFWIKDLISAEIDFVVNVVETCSSIYASDIEQEWIFYLLHCNHPISNSHVQPVCYWSPVSKIINPVQFAEFYAQEKGFSSLSDFAKHEVEFRKKNAEMFNRRAEEEIQLVRNIEHLLSIAGE